MRRFCSLIVLLANATAGSAADPRQVIDPLVGPFREGKKNLGLVVGVVTPAGRFVFGYGTVTVGPDEVVPDGDTIFELGSITKAYTGVLLAVLEQDGRVKLDDPANKYLPAELRLPRRGDRAITLLDLSTHHSGLPVEPPLIGWRALLAGDAENPYRHYDTAKLAKDLSDLWPQRDAGEKYEYSNLGAGILGHALANAAKAKSYEDALVRHVLTPLRMNDTRISLTPAQSRRFPPSFTEAGAPTAHWDFACLEGCGGLRSTAHDQLTFLSANVGLTPTPLAAALTSAATPRRDTASPRWRVGLGWHVGMLRPDGGPTVVWHDGGTYGSRSFAGFILEARIGVIVLSNTGHSVDDLAISILRRLGDVP
jgi:serine-type D-Ala-D-Ala carboxypeptidase/endopeptidase